MTANRIFAVVFAFVLFFLSISTVALAIIENSYDRLPSMLWEEEFFATARAYIDKAIGIVEINGVYVSDDTLIKITPQPDADTTQANIQTVRDISSSVFVPTYTMIVPTANVILQNKLPDYASIWDQNKYINEIYEVLVNYSSVIPTYDTLFVNNTKDIFYRTSDNITPLGGYYLYRNLSQRLGFYPQNINDFNIEYIGDQYFGELFDSTGYRRISGDDIAFYRSAFYAKDIRMTVYDNHGNRAVYKDIYTEYTDDLNCYPGGTFPVTNIENRSVEGKKLLIFSDKTVKSVVGFLVDNYEMITVVNPFADTDNYRGLESINEYDQIVFMFSADSFGHRNLNKISEIINR